MLWPWMLRRWMLRSRTLPPTATRNLPPVVPRVRLAVRVRFATREVAAGPRGATGGASHPAALARVGPACVNKALACRMRDPVVLWAISAAVAASARRMVSFAAAAMEPRAVFTVVPLASLAAGPAQTAPAQPLARLVPEPQVERQLAPFAVPLTSPAAGLAETGPAQPLARHATEQLRLAPPAVALTNPAAQMGAVQPLERLAAEPGRRRLAPPAVALTNPAAEPARTGLAQPLALLAAEARVEQQLASLAAPLTNPVAGSAGSAETALALPLMQSALRSRAPMEAEQRTFARPVESQAMVAVQTIPAPALVAALMALA